MTDAVIVLDMLNDFVTGEIGTDRAERIIPTLRDELLPSAHAHDVRVIYSNDAHRPEDFELEVWGEHAMRGTEGAEVIPELEPAETDDADLPEKPDVESLDASNSVGIDLGILNYIHTNDGKTVDWLNLENDYERLGREQRKLSRKEKGSNNYEKQRVEVAKVKRRIRRKVLDYQHKITTWLVREYDAVFVEDLNVKGMLEQSHNTRNKQDAAWRQFITLLEYKAELYGSHVVRVEARGTSKECASCGVETAKPIWVREHSCPSCGFKTDRDANAAMNVLQRGFAELGLGWPEDTPVETVTATDTTHFESVSASHVVETGSLGA